MTVKPSLVEAYASCRKLAQSHYENFPVASLILPRRLRQPVSVIYAFARTADDFADEGDATQAVRLQQLNSYSKWLTEIDTDRYQGHDPIFIALRDVIRQHDLPSHLFHDLLTAFKQDVVKTRYANFDEVLEYCRYSANPVGRLLLHLEGTPTERQLQQSDAICTSLQLINFFQDIAQDYRENHRIYLPLDHLEKAGIEKSQLLTKGSHKLAQVLRPLYRYSLNLMQQGAELGLTLPGRFGWEVRAMTLGGMETLAQLMRQPESLLLSRPRLSKRQHLSVILNAYFRRIYWMRINDLSNHH